MRSDLGSAKHTFPTSVPAAWTLGLPSGQTSFKTGREAWAR